MLQSKFHNALNSLNESLIDRQEEVNCVFAAMLAGEHVLFGGPPGTAKSLLCSSLGNLIDGSRVFMKLMTRQTEPAEIFGPVSLRALKEDRLEYAVDGFLPTADIGFIDEVGKASSAILNALLTMMAERQFDNGAKRQDCPLFMLMGGTNEWPVGEGYENCGALFDRFLIRKSVSYVRTSSMSSLLWGNLSEVRAELSLKEVKDAQADVKAIRFTDDAEHAVLKIVSKLAENGIRPSDRRLRAAMKLPKAVAWMYGRTAVEPADLEVLQHSLWDDAVEHPAIVSQIVIETANPNAANLAQLLAEASDIESTIDPNGDVTIALAKLAKLKDVVDNLKKLPGDRAQVASKRFGQLAQTIAMKLMS